MNLPKVIISQYQASLEMLKQTINRCPAELWSNPGDQTQFWRIAYHALFYTHLYLQDSAQTFTPWIKHCEDYQLLGPLDALPRIGEPYDQATVLEYLAFCQQQVTEKVAGLKPDAPSGFDWLPFDKLELQLYTIRHLQQHAGELMERLGTRAGVMIDWVGMKPG
jgi:hypothetical protein